MGSRRVDQVWATRRVLFLFRRGEYEDYCNRVAHAIGVANRSIDWEDTQPFDWNIVPIYRGSILDHERTRAQYGEFFVEGLLFGLSGDRNCERLSNGLRKAEIEGSLDVVSPAPPPGENSLCLTDILAKDVLVHLRDGYVEGQPENREFDGELSLDVVCAGSEDETTQLEMAEHDFNLFMPVLTKILIRNYKRVLRDPQHSSSKDRILLHAQELHWMGAHGLACIVASRLLERVLSEKIAFLVQGYSPEQSMLGKLIQDAFHRGVISDEEKTRYYEYSRLRAACAHAIEHDESIDVAEKVNEFIEHLRMLAKNT